MKKIICFVLVLTICSVSLVSAKVTKILEEADYNIKIADNYTSFRYLVYLSNGLTYVPLREFCEKLSIPIEWDAEKEEINIDIYNKNPQISNKTVANPNGVIPDEETALSIGKIILEKYMGKELEYKTDAYEFCLSAFYSEEENAWTVGQKVSRRKSNDKHNIVGGIEFGVLPYIKLNKNTGEVMYINTYSSITK